MKDPKDAEPVKFNDPTEEYDAGEMDMGVDLSLDESGVLEAETPTVTLLSDGISEPSSQVVPTGSEAESQSDAHQTGEPSGTDHAVLYPTVEEGDDKHKLSGKRVTFPSDDDIVSGAVEPKDPWRHAQNVTVDDILSSYKQACQKLNCKPIPKVLKQIQELKDLTQRNECLDLKGEKLDYKACESLEEVLKRVQFKVIDLEQTNLDEDGASALFDMIEYYESATHLNISFNKHIGTRGWQAAAHMMRKTSSLQYLDARNTPLLDHSAPFVARALRISGSLAVLHLENAGLSGRPLMLLATALKMNMNLRELYLADNKLNGLQDSAQLGNLLKFNYNIQILDLRNNHILDSGLAYVCEGLKEQRKGLVTLVLWNNQLTHNGMGYLAAALPCTQSLETLNLGHNSVGNEGVHKLKDGLIANRSVLRLGLASTKLSCEGAVAVAEFIAESPRLLRLDLRENEIKTGGLMALSLALKVNTSLLRLDLDREPKKETVKSFIETQRALLAEIQNGCKRNFILAKEKEETEQMMRQSASMAEIATEDGPREEEGEESNIERQEDKTGSEEKPSSQSEETSAEVSVSPMNLDSDSDTEDEEEVITTASSALQSPTPPQTRVVPPTSSPTHPPPSPSTNTISGITVTNSPVPPGTPPSPGRCISVSSPGRGHKIFMVTRVESPPEPQAGQVMSKETSETSSKQTTLEDVHVTTPNRSQEPNREHSVILTTSQQEPASPLSPLPTQPADLPHETPGEELKEATSGDAEEEIQSASTPDQLTRKGETDAKEVGDGSDPKPDGEHPQTEADEQEAAQPAVPCDQTSVTAIQPETEDSADESSADEGEPEVTGSLLPNGLKPEFSLHLLDTDSPKPGSCVMEHVSVSCTQDLEELLLEASLDTGRDAP
ncbi:protein phosphatase 1 regulatory subunit 37 isoform X2 [Festucalex cinctus]